MDTTPKKANGDTSATSINGSTRKVKFVASDPSRGGLPVKRKQVQHACDSCRRKKKRCFHSDNTDGLDAENQDDSHSLVSHTSPKATRSAAASQAIPLSMAAILNDGTTGPTGNLDTERRSSQPVVPPSGISPVPPSPSVPATDTAFRTRSSRFVGDLNPEGMFMEAMSSVSAREASQKGDVGIWLSATGTSSSQPLQFVTARPPLIMDQFLLPFVKEHCMTCLPPEQDFEKLKALFVAKVHPIFPIIPIATLDGDPADPIAIVLKQLVSLAAGTDPDTAKYLKLQNRGSEVLSPADFSHALSSSVRAILETSIIPDRVLHIRALTMLSLYTQPTCAEEADLPAQLGGRAIHHIQTLGLHLLKYEGPDCDDMETIFCAVWALDRINGAVYGRPCLIHERDIGANLEHCIRKRPPAFRLFLLVVQWLDQVVDLYRPGPSAEASGLQKVAYIDLPVLEAMIVDADALNVSSSLIATIETFYHAVIILSCRLNRPGTISAATTLPPPSANARRSLAAERIACAVPRDCLSPLPFVPYAVSLALSVEYRKMRHSRLPMFRARAMTAFRRNCEMLRNFGEYFWSANVVAGLGERVLKEMERAATTLTRDEGSEAPTRLAADQSTPRVRDLANGDSTAIDTALGLDNLVDFSLIDAISGQDVFGHIDPSFNLNAVEDALEANLDIGLPLNWGDWGQFAT